MSEHDTELVVMGGGIAGMIAALRAAEGGCRVIVLERGSEERCLCNSRVTGGVFHIAYRDIYSPEEELERAIDRGAGGVAIGRSLAPWDTSAAVWRCPDRG